MSKANKQPHFSAEPHKTPKTPRGGDKADALGDELFRWRCKHIDFDGQWGFRAVSIVIFLQEIIPRLHHFETMKWSEILGSRSTSDHSFAVSHLVKAARERLEYLKLGHLENLFQISITSRARVWGFKDRAEFNVLWFDPDHSVYPTEKRNT